MSWDPDRYLAFGAQRTRPARDLADRVDVAAPRRVIDLGCGPGNSTEICRGRWPGAAVVGLDSSKAMIEKARASQPEGEWRVGDIAAWSRSDEQFDVVFANASLQWVDEHEVLLPRLLERVAPGGALAVQMPSCDMAPNRLMRELAREESWRPWFPGGGVKSWRSHPLDFYYEVLAPRAGRLDLWATEYVQIMEDAGAIVRWYQGSGLRPYLEAIGEESERERFQAELSGRLQSAYPESAAGGVLFPFRRVFLVAYSG